jgi:hypothetical protein
LEYEAKHLSIKSARFLSQPCLREGISHR